VLYSCRDKKWKIADFGLTAEGTSDQAVVTQYGRGTPGYRAPELIINENSPTYTNKVDIWSLGSILYELIFSRKIFLNDLAVRDYYCQSGSYGEILQLFDSNCKISLDEISKRFVSASLQRMLAIEPRDRPGAKILSELFERTLIETLNTAVGTLSLGRISNSTISKRPHQSSPKILDKMFKGSHTIANI
jgi:serine/threonine protein kinase